MRKYGVNADENSDFISIPLKNVPDIYDYWGANSRNDDGYIIYNYRRIENFYPKMLDNLPGAHITNNIYKKCTEKKRSLFTNNTPYYQPKNSSYTCTEPFSRPIRLYCQIGKPTTYNKDWFSSRKTPQETDFEIIQRPSIYIYAYGELNYFMLEFKHPTRDVPRFTQQCTIQNFLDRLSYHLARKSVTCDVDSAACGIVGGHLTYKYPPTNGAAGRDFLFKIYVGGNNRITANNIAQAIRDMDEEDQSSDNYWSPFKYDILDSLVDEVTKWNIKTHRPQYGILHIENNDIANDVKLMSKSYGQKDSFRYLPAFIDDIKTHHTYSVPTTKDVLKTILYKLLEGYTHLFASEEKKESFDPHWLTDYGNFMFYEKVGSNFIEKYFDINGDNVTVKDSALDELQNGSLKGDITYKKLKSTFFYPFYGDMKVTANTNYMKRLYIETVTLYCKECKKTTEKACDVKTRIAREHIRKRRKRNEIARRDNLREEMRKKRDLEGVDVKNYNDYKDDTDILDDTWSEHPQCVPEYNMDDAYEILVEDFILDIIMGTCYIRELLKTIWYYDVWNKKDEEIEKEINKNYETMKDIYKSKLCMTYDIETTFRPNESTDIEISCITANLHTAGTHSEPIARRVFLYISKDRQNDGELWKNDDYFDKEYIIKSFREITNNENAKFDDFEIKMYTTEKDLISGFFQQARDWKIENRFHWNGFSFDDPMIYTRGIQTEADMNPETFPNGERKIPYHSCDKKKLNDIEKKVDNAKFRKYHYSYSNMPGEVNIFYENLKKLNQDKKNAKDKYLTRINKRLQEEITKKTGDEDGGKISINNIIREVTNDETYIEELENIQKNNDDDEDYSDGEEDDRIHIRSRLKKKDGTQVTGIEEMYKSHTVVAKKIQNAYDPNVAVYDVMYAVDSTKAKLRGVKLDTAADNLLNLHKFDHSCVAYKNIASTWANPEHPITEIECIFNSFSFLKLYKNITHDNHNIQEYLLKNIPQKHNIGFSDDVWKKIIGTPDSCDDCYYFQQEWKCRKEISLKEDVVLLPDEENYDPPISQIESQYAKRCELRENSSRTGIKHHLFVIYAMVDTELTMRILWASSFFDKCHAMARIVPLSPEKLYLDKVVSIIMTKKYIETKWRNIAAIDPYKQYDKTKVFIPNIEYSEELYKNSRPNAAISCHGTQGFYNNYPMEVEDFASEYPSLMTSLNIDPTSSIEPHKLKNLKRGIHYELFVLEKAIEMATHDDITDPKSIKYQHHLKKRIVFYATQSHFTSPTSTSLQDLLFCRKAVRRKQATEKNKAIWLLLDIEQNAYKRLANSFYGGMAMVSSDAGSTITKGGRLLTILAAIYFEHTHNSKLVLADTDSIMPINKTLSHEPVEFLPPFHGGLMLDEKEDKGALNRIWRRLPSHLKDNPVKIPTQSYIIKTYMNDAVSKLIPINVSLWWRSKILKAFGSNDSFACLKEMIPKKEFIS